MPPTTQNNDSPPSAGPSHQTPVRTRTWASLLQNLAGPVGMLLVGLAVMWFQNNAAEQQRAAGSFISSNVSLTEPRTCDISASGGEVQRFAHFLTFPTVSNLSAPNHINPDREKYFQGALSFLEEQFKAVWDHLTVEKVGSEGFSLLITWQGSDSSLKPVLFVSHYDVVPVTAEKEAEWLHGPFSGEIVDGLVWGRGSLDVKFSVIALLESATRLLNSGYQPRRTIIFTFGHDEETGGTEGAANVAALLKSRKIKLELIVDEGGLILEDGVKGLIQTPVALIGTAEKMYTSVELTFHSAGGHSSMPPIDYSDVATQMSRLQAQIMVNRPPPELRAPIPDFLAAVADKSPWWKRPFLYNADTWGLRSYLADQLASSGSASNALVRTTMVVTRMSAGVSDNVMPQIGKMTFNTRHHPDVSQAEVVDFINKTLQRTGIQAEIKVTEASFTATKGRVTPTSGKHYQILKQVIQEYWWTDGQPVTVAPILLTGGTDSKWYADLSTDGILRFVPYRVVSATPAVDAHSPPSIPPMATIHASNERVRAEDYARAICTYERLLRLLSET